MDKKKLKLLMSIDIALLVVAIINLIVVLVKLKGELSVYNHFSICGLGLCCVFAIYYLLVGFKKGYGSTFFILYMNTFALFELLTLVNHQSQTALEVIMVAIRFGSLAVLSQAKDLGEQKSKAIAILLILTSCVDLLNVLADGLWAIVFGGVLIEPLLELSCLLMVIAKYTDKKERGSK